MVFGPAGTPELMLVRAVVVPGYNHAAGVQLFDVPLELLFEVSPIQIQVKLPNRDFHQSDPHNSKHSMTIALTVYLDTPP